MSAAAASSQLSLVVRPTEQWLSAEEVLTATGVSGEWLRLKTKSGEIISREADQKAANGRPKRLYLAASFPADMRAKLLGPDLVGSLYGPLFAGVAARKAPELRITLPDPDDQKQAEERLEILSPIFDYASDPERFTAFHLQDGSPVTSLTRLIQYLAESQNPPISARSISRWLALYRSGGFAALADRARGDKGTSRWATASRQNAELADLAAHAYLTEHLNKRMAYEIVVCRAKQLEIEAPSYETIRTYLEKLPPAVKTLALVGRDKYNELFAPYIRRGYTDFEAGEIIVSDHAWHDVLVQNDLFDAKDRQHMRLRFTGFEDMRSRKLIAYAWSQDGSSRSINTCLRHSLESYGTFREFYCDNGRDYLKVGKGARSSEPEYLPPEAQGVLARLGCTVTFCQPYHGQSKNLESTNHILHQRFDRRWVTYCGPTFEQRPDRCIKALERHKKLLAQGRADESCLPLASEFIRAAALWIELEYNNRIKDVSGMSGLSPNEAFEKFRWQKASPAPEPHILAALLAERTLRIIHECAIKMDIRRFPFKPSGNI